MAQSIIVHVLPPAAVASRVERSAKITTGSASAPATPATPATSPAPKPVLLMVDTIARCDQVFAPGTPAVTAVAGSPVIPPIPAIPATATTPAVPAKPGVAAVPAVAAVAAVPGPESSVIHFRSGPSDTGSPRLPMNVVETIEQLNTLMNA